MGLLRLSVLGTPEVFHDGNRLTFSLRKAQALLLYLAVEGGIYPRSKLAAFLWPDSEPHDARTALRNALALLRTLLADTDASSAAHSHLLQSGDLLGLDPQAPLDLDLHRVQQAYQQAQLFTRPPTEEQRSALITHLEQALALVRGPFLDGFWLREEAPFDEWLQQQQHQWQVRLQLLFDRLSSWHEAALEHEQAQAILTRWLALDPLQEEAYRRLMRVHLALGEPNAAWQVYVNCRARLDQALQVEPSPQTVALAGRIRSSVARRNRGTAPRDDATDESGPPDELLAPLVGRSAALSQIVARYQQARLGQPQVVLVVGEAGMGKTRLAEEFVGWARAQGADVLQGQAWEAGGGLPYQPLIEAIRQRLEEENAPDDLLDDLWLAELGRLLPEVRVRYPDLPLPSDDKQTGKVHVFEAVARLVEALGQRGGPLVVVLEDLQWVDGGSLDLLRYLSRDWIRHGTPVLLLGTVCSETLTLNAHLAGRLTGLGRDIPLTRVSLQALTQTETLQLLEALVEQAEPGTNWGGEQQEHDAVRSFHAEPELQPAPDPERPMPLPDGIPAKSYSYQHQQPAPASDGSMAMLSDFLYAHTGGQPLFLLETLKLLRDRQGLVPWRRPDGTWKLVLDRDRITTLTHERPRSELIPASLRALIMARLARLSPSVRQLVLASAVLGTGTSPQRLWQVAELEEQAGVEALEEAIGNGFLREEEGWEDVPGRYRCTYDLVREVLYTELGAVRRRIIQQRALVLLHSESGTAAGRPKPTKASR